MDLLNSLDDQRENNQEWNFQANESRKLWQTSTEKSDQKKIDKKNRGKKILTRVKNGISQETKVSKAFQYIVKKETQIN